MGNLTSSLSVRLNDDVSGPAARAAGALRGLGGAGDALKRLAASSPEASRLVRQLHDLQTQAEKIKAFRQGLRDLGTAGDTFRSSRSSVSQLKAELIQAKSHAEAMKGIRTSAANPSAGDDRLAAVRNVRRVERELRDATGALDTNKAAYLAQGQAVRTAMAAVTSAVGPVRNLRAAEVGVASAIEAVNAALGRQPGLMEAAAKKATRLAEAGKDLAHGMSEAGRRQEQMISSSRRLAEGMTEPARAAARARTAHLEEVATAREKDRVHRLASRREAVGILASGTAVRGAITGKRVASDAVTSVAEFDHATRKQEAFTDISKADQVSLQAQAKRIGQETQFSNTDVVYAQTAAMQGLPGNFGPRLKAEVAEGIVDNVRDYATLMDTDLKEGSETIRSYLQSSGKDISTKAKALAEAQKATNQIVKMAKLGGMSGEDTARFVNYAASPGTSAGLSAETVLTLGSLARRGGLRGDEAGVFMRATASKLVSPTIKGVAALSAAGINHSDFVNMPETLSTDALESQFQTSIGKGFTPEVRARVEAVNTNKELVGDRAKYTAAITQAVGDILGKKNDGTVRASDSKAAAKAAGTFHKLSATSVDTEGLLDKVMSSGLTLAQLNAFLTDKHGGKGAITGRQWEEFKGDREQIKAAGNDPDHARRKANEVYAGVYGSFENMKGSLSNFTLEVGRANEGLIKFAADGIGNAVDGFSKMSTTAQQVTSLLGAGAALGGGVLGSLKLAGALLGNGGGAVALTGSAVALDGSAAALTAAAARLGIAGAIPAAVPAAIPAAVPAAAPALGATAATAFGVIGAGIGTLSIGAVALYLASKQMPKVIDERGAAAFDAATGFTPDANPMEGMAPDRPWATEWLKRQLPSIFGKPGEPALSTNAGAAKAAGLTVRAPGASETAPMPLPALSTAAGALETARAAGVAGDVTTASPAGSSAASGSAVLPTPRAPLTIGEVMERVERGETARRDPLRDLARPEVRREGDLVAGGGTAPSPASPAASTLAPGAPAPIGAVASAPVPDASKIAEATSQLAAYRQELAGIKADLATGLDMPGIGSGMETRKAELEAMIEGVEGRLKALGATTIAPQVDGSAVEGLGTSATAAGDKLAGLNATVAPQVDRSAIDSLSAALDGIIAKLARLGSGLASARSQASAIAVPAAPRASPGPAASASGDGLSTGKVRHALHGSYSNGNG